MFQHHVRKCRLSSASARAGVASVSASLKSWSVSAHRVSIRRAAAAVQAMVDGVDHDYFGVTMIIITLYCTCCLCRDLKDCIGWWFTRQRGRNDGLRDPLTSETSTTMLTPMSTATTTTTSRIGKLWVTPNGDKFHVDSTCRGLHQARKVYRRSACLFCKG